MDVFARFYLPFNELWAASELLGAGARLVRVCTFECLVRLKRTAGRPSEARYVEALLAVAGPRGKG